MDPLWVALWTMGDPSSIRYYGTEAVYSEMQKKI